MYSEAASDAGRSATDSLAVEPARSHAGSASAAAGDPDATPVCPPPAPSPMAAVRLGARFPAWLAALVIRATSVHPTLDRLKDLLVAKLF